MGCDIHLAVEKRVSGKWQNVPWLPMEQCWSCGGEGHKRDIKWDEDRSKQIRYDTVHFKERCEWCKGRGSNLYHARSYGTFAILADVRNGSGFAGIKTGDGFIPISQPRGLPDDMDPKTGAEDPGEDEGEAVTWLGDHSHSWLSVRDLIEYKNWDSTTHRQGVVSPAEYAAFKTEGQPRSWSGDVSGSSVVHVSNEQMDAILAKTPLLAQLSDGDKFSAKISYFTSVRWEVAYWEAAWTFYTQSLPVLRKLARQVGSPDDVRIVFGFDS